MNVNSILYTYPLSLSKWMLGPQSVAFHTCFTFCSHFNLLLRLCCTIHLTMLVLSENNMKKPGKPLVNLILYTSFKMILYIYFKIINDN